MKKYYLLCESDKFGRYAIWFETEKEFNREEILEMFKKYKDDIIDIFIRL